MKKIILFSLLFISLFSFSVNASDNIPTKGKEFWIGVLENHPAATLPLTISVFISSDKNTSGTISIPAQGYSQSFTVVANVTTTITLPSTQVMNTGSETVSNKGVYIVTNDDVSVFALNLRNYISDATKVLPIQSLGTDYRISASYKGYNDGTKLYSEILIVASDDNTEVVVTPSVATKGGNPANVPFTVKLNKGETYQIHPFQTTDDMGGTTIVATEASGDCRPFAIFSGSQCTNIPTSCTACDHLYEQEFPRKTWGMDYYLVPFSFASTYTYRVVADQDNTTLTINGATTMTLNAGESYEKNSESGAICLSANKPVSAVQYLEGGTCTGGGDPSNLILNSSDQKIEQVTFATVTSTVLNTHVANVIMETAYISQLTLDGTPVLASQFKNFTSCSGYSYAQLPLTQGSHTFAADSGFIAYIYGSGSYESYAYSVGSYSKKPVIVADSSLCTTNAVTLVPAKQLYNPRWANADAPDVIISTAQSITVHPSTSQVYIVKGTSLISSCEMEFRFSVEVPTPPAIILTKGPDNLCKYQSVQLNAKLVPSSSAFQYLWTPNIEISNNTISNPVVNPSESRWYYCSAYTASGCSKALDSIYVNVIDGKVSLIDATADKLKYCLGGSSQFNVYLERINQYDNFNSGTNASLWSSISLGTSSSACGSVSGKALYFNGTGTRSATTLDFNFTTGGTLQFDLKLASGTSFPCDDVDPGEDVVLEYSTNGGFSWTTFNTYYQNAYPSFKTVTVVIPTAAKTAATRFRWRQLTNSGNNQDNWALENVLISTPASTSFTYLWSPTTGVSNPAIANPIVTPLATTKYSISVTDQLTGCKYNDTLAIDVGQSFSLTKTKDTVLCNVAGVKINVTPNLPGTYTYSWTPTSSVSSPSIKNPIVTPTSTTKYYVTVTSNQGCVKKDSILITVKSLSSFTITPKLDSLCKGESTQLTAKLQAVSCGTVGSTCSSLSSVSLGSSSSTTSSSYTNPYSGDYLSSKRQLLITKAELNAIGLTGPTTIQQLGFNILSGSASTFQNFTVKIGCTSVTNLSSGSFVSNLKTVINPKTVNTALGINYHVFDNSYDWDGTSNLLVELCFSNTSYPNFSYVYYTSTSYISQLVATGSSVCNATTGYTYSYRPDIYFKYCATPVTANSLTYTWTPATGLSSTTISNPIASPIVTTTYKLLVKDNTSSCTFLDSAKVLVGNNFTIDTKDTVLCSTSGIKIDVIPSFTGNYTYKWTPSSSLSSSTVKSPIASPTNTTKYYVTVTSLEGCQKKDSLTIRVNSLSSFKITPKSDSLCIGESVKLTSVLQPLCGTNGNKCTGTPSLVQVGTETYSSSSYDITPYYGSYNSSKKQFLITKAELNALGMVKGSTIQQLGFNVSSGSGSVYQNFTIKMACTPLTNLSSGAFVAGLQTVFNPKNVTIAAGVNYHVFDNAYDWDGVSNIVVETCFSNTTSVTSASVYYTYTSTYMNAYTYGASVCGATSGSSYYYRPNIYLRYCDTPTSNLAYTWTPATGLSSSTISNPIASPIVATTYKLVVKDNSTGCLFVDSSKIFVGPNFTLTAKDTITKCSSTGVALSVVTNPTGTYTYNWAPSTGLTGPYTSTPNANPIKSTRYYVKVASSLGCTKTDSILVLVPVVGSIKVSPRFDSLCVGQSTQLSTAVLKSNNCGTNGNTCTGTPSIVQVGTDTYSSSSYDITPYYGSYTSSKKQFLITKAELNALGMVKGSTIQQLGFNISSGAGSVFQNFTIKMGCTTATDLYSSTFITGLQTVFNAKNVTTVTGMNYHVFDNAYDWDGVSNIVVETCFSNSTTVTSASVYYTYSSAYMNAYTYGSSVCNATSGSSYYYRPNIYLKYCDTPSLNLTYTWTPATGLSSTTIANPIATPSSTTTYKLVVKDKVSGCILTDSSKISVGPSFTLSAVDSVTKCSTNGVGLSVAANPTGTYTYSWTPVATLTNANTSTPTANPAFTTKYYVKVASSLGCIKRDSIKVLVPLIASVQVTPKFDSLCSGQSTQLASTIVKSSLCGTNGNKCTGTPSLVQVGTDNYSSSSYDITPYYGSYNSSKKQFLITKAELNALGMVKGSTIQQLGFNISSGAGSIFQGFTIKMGCTSATSLSSGVFISGLQTVFNAKNVTTVTGVNYHVFDNAYDWDGVSNIVVETCFSNSTTVTSASVYYTYTSSYMNAYTYGSSVCAATSGSSYYYRPNIYLKYCDTPVSTIAYTWSPATGLSSSTISNPVATPTVSTVYKLIAKDNISGCSFSDSTKIIVGPSFTLTAADTVNKCSANAVALSVVANPTGTYTYSWTPSTTLTGANTSTPSANPVSNTKYYVKVASSLGCIKRDSIVVVLSQKGSVVVSPKLDSVCLGQSSQLSSTIVKIASCGTNGNKCTGTPSLIQVGTDNYSSSSYDITPYYGSYNSSKKQFLITKAELNALGMVKGSTIQQLGFNIYSGSGSVFQGFTIKMGCTSATSLSSGVFISGLQTVFNAKNVTTVTGVNYHVFDNAYDWDGVSNIVVETCFSNSTTVTSASVYYTYSGSYMNAYTYGSSVCGATSGSSYYYRPNIYLKYCDTPVPSLKYTWTPATGLSSATISNPIATPLTTTTYKLVVTDGTSICPFGTDSVKILVKNPLVVNNKKDTSACVGDNLSIKITNATGLNGTYQWYLGSTLISGATNSVYTISPVSTSSAGVYTVKSTTGICKNTVSNAINVVVNGATITSQPVNKTVCEGTAVTFSATATGANLTYQWMVNTGTGYTAISGATSSTYSIGSSSVTTALNGYKYKVEIKSNGSCPLNSNEALLTVSSNVAITTQPAALTTLCTGSAYSTSIVVSGSNLTYQWYKGTTLLVGATNSTFSIPSVAVADSGSYHVVVSGGCSPLTSNDAVLKINGATITSQPVDKTICEGSGVSFSATATGPGLTYQWMVNTGTGYTAISGATSSTYSITGPSATTSLNGYKYKVEIKSNGSCPINSNEALLTVNSNASITTQPVGNTSLCTGGAYSVSVVTSGSNLTYQWYKGTTLISGETNATFSISTVALADSGIYHVVVSGGCTPLVSTDAVLKVNGVVITSQPVSKTVCAGTSVDFSTTATGPGLTYQWMVNTGTGFTAISGATSATYSIAASTVDVSMDGYKYKVDIKSNGICGETSNEALLTVSANTVITTQPVANTSLCAGSAYSLSVVASGSPTYQWYKGTTLLVGATNSTFNIPAVVFADSGSYHVVISGICSPITSNDAVLKVNGTQITSQPANKTVCAGNDVDFSTTAIGPGLTYQWLLNTGTGFNPISGATSSTYSIAASSVSISMNGYKYKVEVKSNGICDILSSEALLTVNATPLAPVAGDSTYCKDVTPTSLTATGTNLIWYSLPSGGIGSTTAPAVATNAIGVFSNWVSQTVNNCESPRTKIDVTIIANPILALIPDQIACFNGSVSYQAVITNTLTNATYQWQSMPKGGSFSNVNPGNSATLTLNALTFAMDSSKVHVTVSETVNGKTCSTTSNNALLRILNKVSVTNVVTGVDICEGSNGSVLIKNADAGITYDVYIDAKTNPVVATAAGLGADLSISIDKQYLASGIHIVYIKGHGCDDEFLVDTAMITVLGPTKEIVGSVEICTNSATGKPFTTTKVAGASSYVWSITSGGLVTSSGDTNAIVKVPNLQDSCLLSVEAYTANGFHCSSKSIWIKPIEPVANLTITHDTICTGSSITVQISNGGKVGKLAQWLISPSSGVSIVDQDSIQTRAYSFNNDGDYQISMTNECGSSATKNVHVIASPVAYAGENIILNGGGTINLDGTGSSTGSAYIYEWKSSVGASIDAKDQLITNSLVASNDIYTLTVSTTNAYKCSDSASFEVLIDYGVKIPNVFSPNDDNKHDVLEILNIQFYKNAVLYVYNQWGELIFESEPGYIRPWDGTRNGRKCDVSAYYYVLEFNERDKKPLTGPVTLVR